MAAEFVQRLEASEDGINLLVTKRREDARHRIAIEQADYVATGSRKRAVPSGSAIHYGAVVEWIVSLVLSYPRTLARSF